MVNEAENAENARIAHLTMLQGVIARMGANSFTLKALAVTFGSASFVVMATVEDLSPCYALGAIAPVLIFWLLDARYLRLERAYRKLYDHVRRGREVEAYDMDASPFMKETASFFWVAVSWSTLWFYIAILCSLGIVALLVFKVV